MLEAFAAQQREALAPTLEAIAAQQRNVLVRFALSAQLVDQLDLVAFSSMADTVGAQAKALLDSFQLPEGLIEGFQRLGWELPSSWPADRIEDVYNESNHRSTHRIGGADPHRRGLPPGIPGRP